MAAERYLIVNADDFGQSLGVNQGVIETFEKGIVTSASLMVRWPAAASAAEYSRRHPSLSVGLHIDLGEWTCRDGAWAPVYEVSPLDDSTAIAQEIARQLAAFRRLLGRNPTHIDSHQHVHRDKPARGILSAVARQLGVPLRDCHPNIRYCGDFYGQTGKGVSCPDAISMGALIKIIKALPPGVTELACHPGRGDDIDSMYCSERGEEVTSLCHPQVRATLLTEGIELRSFGNIPVVPNIA